MRDYLNVDDNNHVHLGEYRDEYSFSRFLTRHKMARGGFTFPLFLLVPAVMVLLLLALLVAALVITP